MSARRNNATVRRLCDAMDEIAPLGSAAEWDNVGLLVGDASWPLRRLVLTIDLTPAVLAEARRKRADALLSYHPPIFRPLKRMLLDPRTQDGLAAAALSHRIAVYSPHTALDAAPGGTNETLAALAGLDQIVPFETSVADLHQCKVVVFVPADHVEALADAVFAAGAGHIGDYRKCSFRLAGQGTFFGTGATAPVVGRKGRLERVDEIRMEAVVPRTRLADVTAAIRRSHPYEEPAFDIYPLEPAPRHGVGQGRIGTFRPGVRLSALVRRLERASGAALVATIGRPDQTLRRGFVCAGAAGSLPFDVPDRPCGRGDVVITGEIRHHDALRVQRCGAAAVALGHWASERPVLRPLARRLATMLPGVTVSVSRADRDPFIQV